MVTNFSPHSIQRQLCVPFKTVIVTNFRVTTFWKGVMNNEFDSEKIKSYQAILKLATLFLVVRGQIFTESDYKPIFSKKK